MSNIRLRYLPLCIVQLALLICSVPLQMFLHNMYHSWFSTIGFSVVQLGFLSFVASVLGGLLFFGQVFLIALTAFLTLNVKDF
jgi:hypothetical protein